MREVISTCPVCEHELSVTRLHCRECGTTLEGEFSVGRFSRLTRDQMRVLESFLRSRGNLREMERDLGLSYPTVRSRVDALVRSLGFVPFDSRAAEGDVAPGIDPAVATERRRILEALARHEIDAEAAAAALRRLISSTSSPAVAETAALATAVSSPEPASPSEATTAEATKSDPTTTEELATATEAAATEPATTAEPATTTEATPHAEPATTAEPAADPAEASRAINEES